MLDVVWRSLAWPGLEHVLWSEAGGLQAKGEAVHHLPDEGPVRLRYRLDASADGRTRLVEVEADGDADRSVRLIAEPDGGWSDDSGTTMPALDGCVDVDISTSPLTNTLPIRRLDLVPGESANITVVYIDVPTLTVSAATQRYTCLFVEDERSGYRYESGTFSADLVVDPHGLVLDYADLWQRLPTAALMEARRTPSSPTCPPRDRTRILPMI